MQRFIIFRAGQAIIAVLLVSIIVFMLSNITGDPNIGDAAHGRSHSGRHRRPQGKVGPR